MGAKYSLDIRSTDAVCSVLIFLMRKECYELLQWTVWNKMAIFLPSPRSRKSYPCSFSL